MQQRQLRLGDILDDYCPRERRITNHVVVAMIGADVKQTRCVTCDADHTYKHAKVPRQRRKSETPAALYSQVAAGAPKVVAHESETDDTQVGIPAADSGVAAEAEEKVPAIGLNHEEAGAADRLEPEDSGPAAPGEEEEEGPVHRPLIRATLPRQEGQPPPTRPAPDFTIRQPGGRQNRFRPRHQRGGQGFQGNRSGGAMGGGPPRGGMPRQGGGRPPIAGRLAHPQGHGRKRSK